MGLVGRFRWVVAALAAAGLVTVAAALHEARADPLVRRLRIHLPHWPVGAASVRVALLSDVHLGSLAMGTARLDRIVAQVNATRPDLVLLAGDFVDGDDHARGKREAAALPASLSRLHAPLGVVAVLGNHDHWVGRAAVTAALEQAGVTVLRNGAVERGPLAILGMDDASTHHARPARMLAAARGLPGAPVLLTHASGLWQLPKEAPALVLAGHTHCGQIVLPLLGAIHGPLLVNRRYSCGIMPAPGRLTIVSAGLGTSIVPLRLGAPPDWWLLTLGP